MSEGDERFELDLGRRWGALREWFRASKPYFIKNFLILGLMVAVLWGLAWPTPGAVISNWRVAGFRVVSTINVVIIFFISGLSLKTDDIKDALRAWGPLLYGFIMILFVTPMAGFIAIALPLQVELTTGLALFACVPTTLTSGVTMVREAGGNWVLAMLLTVGTNLLAVLTLPVSLKILLQFADVNIDALDLLWKLSITKLVPLVLGKAVQTVSAGARGVVAKHKVTFGLTNNFNLVMIVWQTISRASNSILTQSFGSICAIILCGVCLHVIYLLVNLTFLSILKFKVKEHKAVMLMCSQKTLPVAMAALSFLNEEQIGDAGLVAIPCIIGHLSQLFIDARIVSAMRPDPKPAEAAIAVEDAVQELPIAASEVEDVAGAQKI